MLKFVGDIWLSYPRYTCHYSYFEAKDESTLDVLRSYREFLANIPLSDEVTVRINIKNIVMPIGSLKRLIALFIKALSATESPRQYEPCVGGHDDRVLGLINRMKNAAVAEVTKLSRRIDELEADNATLKEMHSDAITELEIANAKLARASAKKEWTRMDD